MTPDWALHAEPGKASACGYELWRPQSREEGVPYSILREAPVELATEDTPAC